MPYGVYNINNMYCLYKKDGNKRVGDALSCHSDKASANKHLQALYAVERFNHFQERAEVSYKPTSGMKSAASRALQWRQEYGRGGTAVGIARARDIVNGKNLPLKTVRRMFSFFSRHEVDKKATGFSAGEEGYPSNGRIAWDLWGGDSGFSWSRKIVEANRVKNIKRFANLITEISRVFTLEDVYEVVASEFRFEDFEDFWIHDLVFEDTNFYFVFSSEGRMYKLAFSEQDKSIRVESPEVIQVRELTVSESNNKITFYGVAGAATINRNGEIDTMALYNNLVKRFNEKNTYFVNFYHNRSAPFVMGKVTSLETYNEFLIVTGEIDMTTPLGKYAKRAIETGEWGFSIEFYALQSEVEKINGVKVRKYTDGFFDGIAILKNKDAASYKTIIKD